MKRAIAHVDHSKGKSVIYKFTLQLIKSSTVMSLRFELSMHFFFCKIGFDLKSLDFTYNTCLSQIVWQWRMRGAYFRSNIRTSCTTVALQLITNKTNCGAPRKTDLMVHMKHGGNVEEVVEKVSWIINIEWEVAL